MPLEEWEKQIKVNLTGAFLCSKYAIINGCEKIINIGSTSCFEGRKNWSAYGVSKVGLLSLTESLRNEGVDSQIICFGRTWTPLRRKLFLMEM
jgi:NAD(P)-dependent dehydrogenase (short-subunit alcohol dehydrogenase family)